MQMIVELLKCQNMLSPEKGFGIANIGRFGIVQYGISMHSQPWNDDEMFVTFEKP